MYITDEELERRLDIGRQRGATEEQIEAKRAQILAIRGQPKPKDNFITSTVKAIADPAIKAGRDAVGSVVAGGSAVGEAISRIGDPQNKNKFFDKGIKLGTKIMTPQFARATSDTSTAGANKSIGTGIQRGAGVASYMIPGGKTLKGAAGLGAASGALYGASQGDKLDLNKITGGMAGGAVGGVVAKGAGQLLNKAGKLATETAPKKIMNTVFKEPLKDTRAAISKGTKTLGEEALERGERGLSDEKIYENAVTRLNQFEDELQSKLIESKRIIPIADLKQAVAPLVKKYQSSGNLNDAQAILNRIDALETYHGKAIPVSIANEIKRTLYDEARNSYGKLSSESMEGIKALAKALKEGIASKVPGASKINEQLSYNGRIADSLIDSMARSGRNRMLGITDSILTVGGIAGVPATGGASMLPALASKALESTGTATSLAVGLNRAGNVAKEMGVGRILNSPVNSYIGTQVGQRAGSAAFPVGDNVPDGQATQYQHDSSGGDIHNPIINPTSSVATPKQTGPVMPMQARLLKSQGVDLKQLWVVHPDGTKIWNPSTQKWVAYNKDVYAVDKPKALTDKQRSYVGAGRLAQDIGDILDSQQSLNIGPVAGRLSKLAEVIGTEQEQQTALKSKIALARTAAKNALLGANMSPQEIESLIDATFDINLPRNVLRERVNQFIQGMNTLAVQDTTGINEGGMGL